MDWFKKLFGNSSKKRILQNAAIVIIIGMIVIIAGGSFFGKGKVKTEKNEPAQSNNVQEVSKLVISEEKSDIEKNIEKILSQIEGAGKVNVMITYVSGKELVPATDMKRTENDVQEKDSGGGSRNTKQHDIDSKVVFEDSQGGGKKPVILKELQPEVKGVIVVADGASEPQVKENLTRAVQVLVDVPVHRIQVFPRDR